MTTLPLHEIPTFSEISETFPGLKAIFFDMDGTLLNTEAYHTEALAKIGRDHHIQTPYDPETVHRLLMGKADYLVYEIVRTWEGFPKDWTVKDFVDEKTKNLLGFLRGVDPSTYFPPQTLLLLKTAKEKSLYLALVTSSERVVTEELLRMTGVYDLFDLILTRDDCPKHKPDPWPYLKAQELAELTPTECLIFEDSSVGLTAAVGSGSHVVKVEWF
jgi:HAD superfamily hydrolase (TIGR01509 family)